SLLLLFPAPEPENKVFLNVSLFNRVFLHVGQVGHQQYDTFMFLDFGRKPEYQQRDPGCMETTCKLHAERHQADVNRTES
ncbi:hypothetical protein ATANTOWER_014134, partial [Ataeniobius toweri]|nr:hypothetical protein [Ataeniobius toweri]